MIKPYKYTDTEFFKEFAAFMLPEMIASGSSRVVYKLNESNRVIKVDYGAICQNVREWIMWEESENTPIRKWLAPCINMTRTGKILMQEGTRPPHGHELPDMVPSVLADLKVQNWGIFEDRLVCHDYGMNYAHTYGMKRIKLVKARWWDGDTGKFLDTGEPIN